MFQNLGIAVYAQARNEVTHLLDTASSHTQAPAGCLPNRSRRGSFRF